jgi:WD40 repeat protein
MGHFCCFLKVRANLLIIIRDGRILSGGMDKLLCLWDAKVVKCQNLVGHNGSISKVKVDDQNIAVTSAYDSSLLVWNLDTKECL